MGHVPSKELAKEPFVVNMETSRGNVDTVAAIALTEDNMPDPNHPLFQQFQSVRCDAPVLFWYCAPSGEDQRTDLPPAPDEMQNHAKRCTDAQNIIDRNLAPKDFVPLPIMLVRLARKKQEKKGAATGGGGGDNDDAADRGGETSSALPSSNIVCGIDITDAIVIGYFGCRSFGGNGVIGERSIVGIFLNKQFFNDAKSIAIISIACKAYSYFCRRAGLKCSSAQSGAVGEISTADKDGKEDEEEFVMPWPKEIEFDTQEYNLPCLRLIQKIYQCYVYKELPEELQNEIRAYSLELFKAGAPPPEIFNFQYRSKKMYAMCREQRIISAVCQNLANEIQEKEHVHQGVKYKFWMKAAVLQGAVGSDAGVMDEIVEEAKKRWREMNEPVIRSQLKAKEHAPNQSVMTHKISNKKGRGRGSQVGSKSSRSTSSSSTGSHGKATGAEGAGPVSPPKGAVRSSNRKDTTNLIALPTDLSSGPLGGSSTHNATPSTGIQPPAGSVFTNNPYAESGRNTPPHGSSSYPGSAAGTRRSSLNSSLNTTAQALGASKNSAPPFGTSVTSLASSVVRAAPPSYVWSGFNSGQTTPNTSSLQILPVHQQQQSQPPATSPSQSQQTHVVGRPIVHQQQQQQQQQTTFPRHDSLHSPMSTGSQQQQQQQQQFNTNTSYPNNHSPIVPNGAQQQSSFQTQPGAFIGQSNPQGEIYAQQQQQQQFQGDFHLQPRQQHSSALGGMGGGISSNNNSSGTKLHLGELFVGDMSPVYVCNSQRQWIPVFWNEPSPVPIRRSMFQLSDESSGGTGPMGGAVDSTKQKHFVCYDIVQPSWLVDHQGQRFQSDMNQPYLFLEKGLILHAFVNGQYVAVPAQ